MTVAVHAGMPLEAEQTSAQPPGRVEASGVAATATGCHAAPLLVVSPIAGEGLIAHGSIGPGVRIDPRLRLWTGPALHLDAGPEAKAFVHDGGWPLRFCGGRRPLDPPDCRLAWRHESQSPIFTGMRWLQAAVSVLPADRYWLAERAEVHLHADDIKRDPRDDAEDDDAILVSAAAGEGGPAKPMTRREKREMLLALLAAPIQAIFAEDELLTWPEPGLREYQMEGAAWLMRPPSGGRLLADEMGLGKTIQAIAAARLLAQKREDGGGGFRCLVLAPGGLLRQWKAELVRWAPEFKVLLIDGSPVRRQALWHSMAGQIVLASYDAVRLDLDPAKARSGPLFREWDVVVCDEAQRIKNAKLETAKKVKMLRRRRSWALTGTPLENRVDEIGSIIEFVANDGAELSVDADRARALFARYGLRRHKKDHLAGLPPKILEDVYVEMGDRQQEEYRKAESEAVLELEKERRDSDFRFKATARLNRLLLICNSSRTAPHQVPKFEQLVEHLDEVHEQGQRALVFSKFVEGGDHPASGIKWLADELAKRRPSWRVDRYHGEMSEQQKTNATSRLQAGETDVLFVSIRAGGVGLNLQAASYVFHYDRWWNPAVEQQAEDRSHRFGQTETVTVMRYITAGTVEERVAEILAQKQDLIAKVVDNDEGYAQAMVNNLEMSDLRYLFGIEAGPPPSAVRPLAPGAATSWERYEEMCRARLEGEGYEAKLTAPGADGGIDVIARMARPKRLAVLQAKDYEHPVGVEEVRAFIGALVALLPEKPERLVFAARSGFTYDARVLAAKHDPAIELWHGSPPAPDRRTADQ